MIIKVINYMNKTIESIVELIDKNVISKKAGLSVITSLLNSMSEVMNLTKEVPSNNKINTTLDKIINESFFELEPLKSKILDYISKEGETSEHEILTTFSNLDQMTQIILAALDVLVNNNELECCVSADGNDYYYWLAK